MSAAEIFRTYLERFTSGDTAGAAELLTDDFRFHGPFLPAEGKAAFLEGSAQLGPILRQPSGPSPAEAASGYRRLVLLRLKVSRPAR